MFAGKELRLKAVEINEARRRFSLPVRSPFLEILARQLLKNETAEHEILRRFIERVGRAHVIFRVSMLKRDLQLHRLALALNLKRQHVSRVRMRADQIGKFNLTVEWIDIVAVWIDLVISDRHDNVTYLHSGFHRRHVGLNASHISTARFAGLARIFTQLRVARRKERKTNCGKTAITLALRFLQKMGDNRRRNRVDELRTRIVT